MMLDCSKPMQGLYVAKVSCQSFWTLKARIELSVFAENYVEIMEKEDKIPHLAEQKGEVNFWFWFVLNVIRKKIGRMGSDTIRNSRFNDISVKYVVTDLAKVLKIENYRALQVKSAS